MKQVYTASWRWIFFSTISTKYWIFLGCVVWADHLLFPVDMKPLSWVNLSKVQCYQSENELQNIRALFISFHTVKF